MNYKELKRKEFLFEIIDDVIGGMDVYNYNGSLWLIKTEELKWAVEFTNDKTLWFNYNLFKNLFKAISLDVSENQKYITEWFESRFLKPEVVEETIQNGVKHTRFPILDITESVEDTIQNGVKETISTLRRTLLGVDDIIQNGVKEIRSNKGLITSYRQNHKAKETIENGVMNTKPMDEWVNSENIIKYTVEYGVKETHEDVYHHRPRICGVIKNGVKEVQPLPAQDGNRDWGNYYLGKQDRTKPFNDYLNDAIKYGKKI
jgi:hypothetical protein